MGTDIYLKKGKEKINLGRAHDTLAEGVDIDDEISTVETYIQTINENLIRYISYTPKSLNELENISDKIDTYTEAYENNCMRLARLYLIKINIEDGWKVEIG